MFSRLSPTWHVSIFPNRLQVVDRESGKSGESSGEHEFSSADELVVDDQVLEHELRVLIDRAFGKAGILGRFPKMHVIEMARPISDTERQRIRTALANAGASKVLLPGDEIVGG